MKNLLLFIFLVVLASVALAQNNSRPVDATTVATQANRAEDMATNKVESDKQDAVTATVATRVTQSEAAIAANQQKLYDLTLATNHDDFIIKIVTAVLSFLTLLVTAIGVPIISAKLAAAKLARENSDAKLDGVLSKHVAMAQAGGYFEGVTAATHPLVQDTVLIEKINERGDQLTRAAAEVRPVVKVVDPADKKDVL